ncbi:hypothetical protein D8674_026134 [Pyrus ussuriensis x Pyrus communis]|uniref:Uncharacterized protein n=1 Tax=Pyrus ussuriensis x Pyrus communis TaxID=2448454 RepID=A0A5N5ID23_9ROSA|nr:hypothetical protein D8674_026134 [Pyrus ussuriensis x Pyrus communis]
MANSGGPSSKRVQGEDSEKGAMRDRCRVNWESWRDVPMEIKTVMIDVLVTNYNFDDITELIDNYLDMLFYYRYKQWKSNLHKHYELFDDPKVALEEGCSLELEDRLDKWAWLCGHFQEHAYVESASQLLPDTLIEFVALPKDTGFQILTETLDVTLRRRWGKYCQGMRQAHQRATGASSSLQLQGLGVTELTHEVVNLKSKLTLSVEALNPNGIYLSLSIVSPLHFRAI